MLELSYTKKRKRKKREQALEYSSILSFRLLNRWCSRTSNPRSSFSFLLALLIFSACSLFTSRYIYIYISILCRHALIVWYTMVQGFVCFLCSEDLSARYINIRSELKLLCLLSGLCWIANAFAYSPDQGILECFKVRETTILKSERESFFVPSCYCSFSIHFNTMFGRKILIGCLLLF